MEFTGKFISETISHDVMSNTVRVMVVIHEANRFLKEYEKLKAVERLKFVVSRIRRKRSLDANAYMWVMLQKMADVLQTDKDTLYLDMLSKYGVFTHIIVKPYVVDRVKQEWRTVRELGDVTVGGVTGAQLQCYFGSSTYNTKEMSVLIDGIVRECEDLNIETISKTEIERIKQQWGVDVG